MPEHVNVSVDQLRQMQADHTRLQEIEAARAVEQETLRIRAGQGNAVVTDHQRQLSEARDRLAKVAVRAELANALATAPVLPHARPQLEALLAGELQVDHLADGGVTVRTKDFRDVNTFVKSRLQDPTWSHFLANQPSPAASQPTPASEPKNLGLAILAQHTHDRQVQQERLGSVQPRGDMSRPFGLRPTR